jgi:hypothetical protein
MFPHSIRKDYWIPLVHAQFPTHLIANHIYKRLLDHRAWRLTTPPSIESLTLTKKRRNQLALNQVPEAIADLAHLTKGVQGRMILNWDRREEKDWATEWSKNIWHCKDGFMLKRGYRIKNYKFPTLKGAQRKKSSRVQGADKVLEPPRGWWGAKRQHKRIWTEMHAKFVKRHRPRIRRRKKANKPKLEKQRARVS